jgi:hypothetical protein
MFPHLMDRLRVARPIGRPKTRPGAVRADKAYSSRAIRAHLRGRGITPVTRDLPTSEATGNARGARGGRPPAFDAADYRNRNVIERRFCPHQAMARPGHPLRQACHRLPRRRRFQRRHRLDTAIIRHALAVAGRRMTLLAATTSMSVSLSTSDRCTAKYHNANYSIKPSARDARAPVR